MCGIGTDWLKAAAENAPEMIPLEQAQDRALIIFTKNPVLGKVKTRLARTMGDEAALAAYLEMVAHVRKVAADVDAHRAVFYTDFIDEEDEWQRPTFEKYLQSPGDLGHRMASAIQTMLDAGYKKVALVGSDFLDLQVQHLSRALRMLEHHDAVLGQADDGGYYLIGMRRVEPSVFSGIDWSTDRVFSQTKAAIEALGWSLHTLPVVQDIDEESDWHAAKKRQAERKL
ncbi:MAG: TIGR04282 family arsenosugar biosynthesis glycosyltransferase [Bacteroidia bacterium]